MEKIEAKKLIGKKVESLKTVVYPNYCNYKVLKLSRKFVYADSWETVIVEIDHVAAGFKTKIATPLDSFEQWFKLV